MPTITTLLRQEKARHQNTINLIASENYPSRAVRNALSSIAGTKYAEGYPGNRYYAGCSIVDTIEQQAQTELLKALVPSDLRIQYHANVQSHSGSQANFAAYTALLQPGDTILSMSLSAGGHLTHGHRVNFSSSLYTIVHYGVTPETGLLDYQAIESLALAHKPKLIIAGASAYSRVIDFAKFGAIAKRVGAYLLADIAHIAGLIIAGKHPHPLPHADIITSTTHKTLRGPRGAFIVCKKELAQRIDKAVMPGMQGGPFMHVIAAKAIAFREAQTQAFKDSMTTTLACSKALAHELAKFGYSIVSSTTDTHLFLIDLSKSIGPKFTGKEAEQKLEEVGIIVNRNVIPRDERSPLNPSGIRIGLAAMVTRGCQPADIKELAFLITAALQDQPTPALLTQIKAFANRFPLR